MPGEQLLLINPRRRRRLRRGSSRRRGKRRMPAALARYWATHRRGSKRTRLANPRRRRRRRHSHARRVAFAKRVSRRPSYRRRRSLARRRVRRSNPRGFAMPRRRRRRFGGYRMRRRRLRNPRRHHSGSISLSPRSLMHNAVVPGLIGAGGAVALDVVIGAVNPYLPATLQAGWFNVGVKAAGAVGVGMLATKFLGREKGRIVMLGGLTVVAYNALRALISGFNITGIPGLSGYQDYTPYPMGAYIRGPTGTPGIQGLGYVSPAAVVQRMSPSMGAYMPRGPMNVAPSMGDYGDGM